MVGVVKLLFISAFTLTIFAYLYEMLWMYYFKNELENKRYGVPEDSCTHMLAENSKDYIENMIFGVEDKISYVEHELLIVLIYFLISSLILSDKLRLWIFNLSENNINIYAKTLDDIPRDQVAFTNIFVFLFSIFYLHEHINFYFQLDKHGFWFMVLSFLIIYLILCPIMIVLFFFLIRFFGAKLIVALYLSMFIKDVYEMFFEEDSISYKLKHVSPKEFSDIVQYYIKKNGLEDEVYQDKTSNKGTNAALIDLIREARIEIQGDFKDFTTDQKNSIILHELGHAEDHSVIKKLFVYVLLLYFEMLIMLFFYFKGSKSLTCEKISKETAFILIALLYFLSCKSWVSVLLRLASQAAETSADMLTSKSEFSRPLAKALFKIAVKSYIFIRPTRLYNAINSMHPTIYDRIEKLCNL